MLRYLGFVGLGLALAAPVSAQTFRAENGVNVTPVAGGFAVASGNGFWARGMWCAAADYARDVLGAGGTQRLYVAQPQPRGSRTPVVFSLDPAGLTPSRVTILGASIRTAGANLSVDHAQGFCADHKLLSGR
ncbi:hypothetical protein [Sulfitobacter sp. JB4-11]|uniref:hypothetical protein n=1 Tax=Sulfitobacter rhodophyticola TaxID=3238304 RepID=UPI00351902F3